MSQTVDVVLESHPASACPHVRALSVRAQRGRTALQLCFALKGDLARLRIPAARAPRAADELWRHTCFEAFVATQAEAAYHEFNFSPSGEWAAYAFNAYRSRAAGAQDPTIAQGALRLNADKLELNASIVLPAALATSALQIGLTAVIEDDAGALSYWALRHAAGKPDFHNRHTFALEFPAT